MTLCIDVGNTNLLGGVFAKDQIKLRFRYDTRQASTSDQLGIFLKSVLRENQIDSISIQQIALCSVVPKIDYSLISACIKYFDIEPFVLQPGVKTGLKIKTRNPLEVGADRIANAIAAVHHFPNENIIVVDLGTATTCCAITANKEYLGSTIMAGIKLSMEALQTNTAKLSAVRIIKPDNIVGRTTDENIQSGLFYGHLGAIREFIIRFAQEVFTNKPPLILGTGGFAYLFENENLFNQVLPDLVLEGLYLALALNTNTRPVLA